MNVTSSNAARHVELEGSSNLRDVGGYASKDGRTIRWGQIFRSGALGRLSDKDWGWMIDHDIGSICDLRSGGERVLVPTNWKGAAQTRHIGIAYEAELVFGPLMERQTDAHIGEMGHSMYRVFPHLLAPSFHMMFDALVDGHTPLIVHCSAGQDRTGIAIALILIALEVPRETIFEDYLLSTDARRVDNEINRAELAQHAEGNIVARFYAQLMEKLGDDAFTPRRLVKRSGQPVLADALAYIEGEWGSVENYLEKELGMDAARRERLREIYLEQA